MARRSTLGVYKPGINPPLVVLARGAKLSYAPTNLPMARSSMSKTRVAPPGIEPGTPLK